eukprot:755054-Rhodomonas_salina.5
MAGRSLCGAKGVGWSSKRRYRCRTSVAYGSATCHTGIAVVLYWHSVWLCDVPYWHSVWLCNVQY